MLIGLMCLTILPSIAVGATFSGYVILAADPAAAMIPYSGEIDYIAHQNLAYWFIALAAIAITSWTWIFRWLIHQLEAQRNSNAATTAQLMAYMEKDHTAMREMLTRNAAVMQRVLSRLPPMNIDP